MARDGMADAHSVIASDAEKFTSLLPNVLWRPSNLSSLGNANLGVGSIKQSAFLGAIVSVVVSTYLVGTGLLPGNIVTIWTYLGYLLLAVVAINIPTLKRMSLAAEHRAKCEASFKFVHSRIRLHAETVALYAAEAVEQAEVRRSFDAVTESSKKFIAWQSLFQSLQVLFQYVPFLVSSAHTNKAAACIEILTASPPPAVYIAKPYILDPASDYKSGVLTLNIASGIYRVRALSFLSPAAFESHPASCRWC
jgi:ABC-type uncharacterized transport system fused permease/ATPase subunit